MPYRGQYCSGSHREKGGTAMPIRYVARETTPLYLAPTGTAKRMELLWGDRLDVIAPGPTRSQVRARGNPPGFVDNDAIGDESLLEVYFIDVGQGDGVLIRTPD